MPSQVRILCRAKSASPRGRADYDPVETHPLKIVAIEPEPGIKVGGAENEEAHPLVSMKLYGSCTNPVRNRRWRFSEVSIPAAAEFVFSLG